MKKIITLLMCSIMALGFGGCSSNDKEKNDNATNNSENEIIDVESKMNEQNFSSSCKDMDTQFACAFKNEDTGEAFVYNEELGIYFQSKDGDLYTLGLNSTMTDEVETRYNEILNKSGIKYTDINKVLKNKYETEYKKSEYNPDNYKSYPSGTYEVGSDIETGEYLILYDNGNQNASIEVRKNEYSDGDDSLYFNEGFYNDYIKIYDGQFVEIDGALLFKLPEAPKFSQNYDNITLKVGRELEPGNYLVEPLDPNSSVYFEVSTRELNEFDSLSELITNDIDFSTGKKIQLKEGQYINLINAICTKQ